MKEGVFEIINSKYINSGGNNGVYITTLKLIFKDRKDELLKALSQLFKEGKIKDQYGIHGKMAMINKPKKTFFKSTKK